VIYAIYIQCEEVDLTICVQFKYTHMALWRTRVIRLYGACCL